ncbi:MAG: hypothetical protein IT488_03405, partial [Gammaproteobacteria bacterium]|nr:hypothetical protein [Gammaproteobacteria bacterium]
AMAGVPLLNGFLSKEMFFAETVYISSLPWVEFGLPVLATVAGVFAVVYALRFSHDIFFGPPSTTLPREPHEAPRWMLMPVALLVLTCLVVGVAPGVSIGPSLAAAARPVVGGTLPEYSLALWHGFTAPLLMSLVAMIAGITGYLFLRKRIKLGDFRQTPLIHRLNGYLLFVKAQAWLILAGRRAVRLLGARGLQSQLFLMVALGGLAALAYAMLTRPAPQSISPYFLEKALPEGGGSNVVNVMLVDFRGFDTLGEITVLGAVALTVYALLRRFRPPRESIEMPRQQRLPPDVATDLVNARTATDTALGYLMVPGVLVRLILPIAGVVAVYLFMRGHNEPGGGFVAGLVVAIAFIAQYMVAGTQWVEAHLNLHPLRWIAAGLLCAVATGLGAVTLGYPFLTSHTAHVTLTVLGEMHIASAMFFDLGVFLVVVGSTLLTLTAMAHQSLRGHRHPPVVSSVAPTPSATSAEAG